MAADRAVDLYINYVGEPELTLKMTLKLAKWGPRPCGALVAAFAKSARGKVGELDAAALAIERDGAAVAPATPVADLVRSAKALHVVLKPAAAPAAAKAPRRRRLAPEPAPVKVALICQLKDASVRLKSFLDYHLALGFRRIYLYFDDPSEADDVEFAESYGGDRVDVRVRDAALLREWAALRGWDRLKKFAGSDVQVRQMLNALHCLARARADGMDWLLHVDSDELFHPGPGETSILPHFRYLQDSGCQLFTYYNFESVPRTPLEGGERDCFRTVTVFKRSRCLTPATAAADRCLEFWKSRSPMKDLFLFYQNGKSAVRCDCDAVPVSVHVWSPVDKRLLHALGRTNDHRNQGIDYDGSVQCRVLHFACTDPKMLWRKYDTLGDFPNACVADTVEHEKLMFHCVCRDAYVKHRGDDDRGEAALADLFRRSVALDDDDEIEAQIAAGVLERVDFIPF